jgi:hypothetical protein
MNDNDQLVVYAEPITSLYYVRTKLPNDLVEKINEDVEYMLKNKSNLEKHNQYLAGNISEEYEINNSFLSYSLIEDFAIKISENYFQIIEDENLNPIKKWDHPPDFFDREVSYNMESLWVNFQKKYEFNPIHTHSGDYSFVIWIRIPYDLLNEINLDNSKNSSQPCNSLFEFHFISASGDISSLPLKVDKNWEGTMIMFPSWINHSVYPFYTSDDYRISISGNIYVKEIHK